MDNRYNQQNEILKQKLFDVKHFFFSRFESQVRFRQTTERKFEKLFLTENQKIENVKRCS